MITRAGRTFSGRFWVQSLGEIRKSVARSSVQELRTSSLLVLPKWIMPVIPRELRPPRIFYGWWIVLAAFLNVFFCVGIVYYGFPVFYPSLVESMQITRVEATQGFFWSFVVVAPLFGLVAGAMIDQFGARIVILSGVGLIGLSLVLMGRMSELWHYYLLCFIEVVGYVLAGPISNQVLIAKWFRVKRGRAMGFAYLGLGLGGAVSPLLIQSLIGTLEWRRAFEVIGTLILVVLFPIGVWVTLSAPRDLGLHADGASADSEPNAKSGATMSVVLQAASSRNFWLLLIGSSLTIGAIGSVVQHLILFLRDQGYSGGWASRVLSLALVASLAGRVIVGYFADFYAKKNVMALFYLVLALAIPLLFLVSKSWVVFAFAILFGFAMGADYMLIPLVAAECFGLAALGRLLALIIMADSLAQTLGPVLAAKIFDSLRSYDFAWIIATCVGLLGAATVFLISSDATRPSEL